MTDGEKGLLAEPMAWRRQGWRHCALTCEVLRQALLPLKQESEPSECWFKNLIKLGTYWLHQASHQELIYFPGTIKPGMRPSMTKESSVNVLPLSYRENFYWGTLFFRGGGRRNSFTLYFCFEKRCVHSKASRIPFLSPLLYVIVLLSQLTAGTMR